MGIFGGEGGRHFRAQELLNSHFNAINAVVIRKRMEGICCLGTESISSGTKEKIDIFLSPSCLLFLSFLERVTTSGGA